MSGNYYDVGVGESNQIVINDIYFKKNYIRMKRWQSFWFIHILIKPLDNKYPVDKNQSLFKYVKEMKYNFKGNIEICLRQLNLFDFSDIRIARSLYLKKCNVS